MSDDDFFDKFDTPLKTKIVEEEDRPLSLEDIFGDDGLFGGSDKK